MRFNLVPCVASSRSAFTAARSVFWIPERVVRGETFADVLRDAQGAPTGYRYAVIDQVTHLSSWFGAADAHSARGLAVADHSRADQIHAAPRLPTGPRQ